MSENLLTSKETRKKYGLTKEEFDSLSGECFNSFWTNAVVKVGQSTLIAEPIWKTFLLVKSYKRKFKLAGDYPDTPYSVTYYPRSDSQEALSHFFSALIKAEWKTAKEIRSEFDLSKEDFKALKEECLTVGDWSYAIVLAGDKTYVVEPLFRRFLLAKSFEARQNQFYKNHTVDTKFYDLSNLFDFTEDELIELMAGFEEKEARRDKEGEEKLYTTVDLHADIFDIKSTLDKLLAKEKKTPERHKSIKKAKKPRKASASRSMIADAESKAESAKLNLNPYSNTASALGKTALETAGKATK